jgi:hypothetical protein
MLGSPGPYYFFSKMIARPLEYFAGNAYNILEYIMQIEGRLHLLF